MKKLIIILALIFVFVIIAWFIIANQLQYRSVKFDLKGVGYTVGIYTNDASDLVSSVTKTSNQRLKEGDYYYKVLGENLNDKQVEFVVASQNKDISVDPDYSVEYLAKLAKNDQETIQTLIKSKYSSVITHYTFSKLVLFKKGEWGGGYLIQIADPRQAPDIYRYVVHKQGDVWKLVTTPQLSLSVNDYPTIPIDALRSINEAVNL